MKDKVVPFCLEAWQEDVGGVGDGELTEQQVPLGLQTVSLPKLFVILSFGYKMKPGCASSWISTEPMVPVSNNLGIE